MLKGHGWNAIITYALCLEVSFKHVLFVLTLYRIIRLLYTYCTTLQDSSSDSDFEDPPLISGISSAAKRVKMTSVSINTLEYVQVADAVHLHICRPKDEYILIVILSWRKP